MVKKKTVTDKKISKFNIIKIDYNFNDFISISDINTTDRSGILLRFSWYGLYIILIKHIFLKNIIFQNIKISRNRILPIQKPFDVAAALPRPHQIL